MSSESTESQATLNEEISKLPAKGQLEARKLQEEIKALQRSRWQNPIFWRDLIGILVVAGTLFFSARDFLEQQSTKQQLEVTREVITLVNNLQTGTPAERKSSAVLLSTWGDKALPVLLVTVSAEEEPGISGAAEAIELIGRQKPKVVLEPVRKELENLFGAFIAGDENSVQPLQNFIVLLGHLRSLEDGMDSRQLLNGFNRKLACDAGPAPVIPNVSKLNKATICNRLKEALNLLGVQNAP